MGNEQYYYRGLNRTAQAVYTAMLTGLNALAPEIRVLLLSREELSDIYFRVKLDNPLLFYVSGFSYRVMPGAEYAVMLPQYEFKPDRIRSLQQQIQARLTKLLRPARDLSPAEKELLIHRFITENVHYDKLKKYYSHEIIGPLTGGVGVCEGIAKTVKLMCDALDIECIVAICHAAPEQGIPYRHAWNVLRMDGKYYHLDATFDLSLGRYGTPRFDYFNLDDARIFRDHQPLVYPLPACSDGDGFYYRKNRLSLTKMEEVGKLLTQSLRKKKENVVFHWRGGGLNRDILAEILRTAEEIALTRSMHAALSCNYGQSVVMVRFSDRSDQEVITEEADENREVGSIEPCLG